MWLSSQGLLRKLTVNVGSGVLLSVRQRWMSTVMSFGYGWDGELGLPTVGMGDGAIAYEPTPIPSLPSDIVSVHAGHHHSLALTSKGQLWAWGCNEEAQLGRGLSNWESWYEPKRVEGLENVKVCTVFASRTVSAAIGDDGFVWVWGKSKHGQLGLGKHITEAIVPARVEALSGENVAKTRHHGVEAMYLKMNPNLFLIKKISFGYEHALARTVDGKLFRWGYSDEEAIGKLPIIWEPRLVEELRGIQVLDIACGTSHSLILCRDGALLSCGENGNGQLGRDGEDSEFLPVEMSFRPVSVAAGPLHSMAICQLDESTGANVGTTKIASWGWNRHYELGRWGSDDQLPGLIDGLDGENPISVSVGCAHSLALTSNGKLWVWGSGSFGTLGFASPRKQPEPYYLDSLEGFQILQAIAGFDHNLVLVAG